MNPPSHKISQAVTTLVTTRQLGFCAAQIYHYCAQQQRQQQQCDIYSFYRVNLLLFEMRMSMVEQNFPYLNLYRGEYFDFGFRYSIQNEDLFRAAETVSAYPTMVGKFLDALGPFSVGNDDFFPAFCRNRHIQGTFYPMSEQVTLSNLRQVVEALADREVRSPVRKAFYDHNPIPGAKWEGAPDNPVLLNPDEIMPVNYTAVVAKHDIDQYNIMFDWMYCKLRKFACTGRIEFKKVGSKSVLISNAQENLRIRDREQGEALVDYYSHITLEGDVCNFWSSRALGREDQWQGQSNLAGELPVLDHYICRGPTGLMLEGEVEEGGGSYIYPHYVNRDKRCAGWYYPTSHRGVISSYFR